MHCIFLMFTISMIYCPSNDDGREVEQNPGDKELARKVEAETQTEITETTNSMIRSVPYEVSNTQPRQFGSNDEPIDLFESYNIMKQNRERAKTMTVSDLLENVVIEIKKKYAEYTNTEEVSFALMHQSTPFMEELVSRIKNPAKESAELTTTNTSSPDPEDAVDLVNRADKLEKIILELVLTIEELEKKLKTHNKKKWDDQNFNRSRITTRPYDTRRCATGDRFDAYNASMLNQLSDSE